MKSIHRFVTILACAALTAPVDTLIAVSADVAAGTQSTRTSPLPKAGVCLRDGAKLVGMPPAQSGKKVRVPSRIHYVPTTFPELPPATTFGGVWVGEVLIDQQGRIARVWPLREFQLKPAFPAFNEAVVTAIRQWLYEPALIDKKPVPMCMSISINVDF